jgi:diguanylate cyclase (GGDEF)-like protein
MDSRAQQALAAVAAVWERSKESILGRVALLEQATGALLEGTLDDALRQQAEREAHKLTGSLGTFGFGEGSRLAREMEHLFRAGVLLGPAEALHLSELGMALRRELERPLVGQVPPPTPREERPLLLVVNTDAELAEQLVVEAVARGTRIEISPTLPVARGALARACPDVVLLDLSSPAGTADGLTLLTELSEQTPPVPVLVLTARDTFTDRVEVARRGGRGFLHKAVPPAQIVEAVVQLLARRRAAEIKVMAVDDDPQILAILQALLESQGIRLTPLTDPLRFWDVLQQESPDLLILDVDMPDLNGIELCQVVRNDQRWTEMPVLFLTAHTDPGTIHRVFAVGADDFVSKPIVGPEFITRVTNRLERIRLLRTLAETDALTGVANRRKSTQVLDQFLCLASRQGQPFCLAVLDMDHFKRVNDHYGHAAGDEVLRRLGELLLRSFRGEDIVARWGGEEFLVGMYGMSRDDGVQRLAAVLKTWRQEEFSGPGDVQFRITFSAGVAEYPTDGADLQALYRAADQALYLAKKAGRDRVLPAGGSPGLSQ